MEIDWLETKRKFDEKYSQSKIARGMGVSKSIFSQILLGTYGFMRSARAKAVVAKLEELGVLVIVGSDEGEHRAAA